MTIDFRPPEEQGSRTAASNTSSAPPAPKGGPGHQRLVVAVVRAAGVVSLLLGLVVLWLQPSFLGEGLAIYVGLALMVTGVFDFVAAAVLKRVWQRLSPPAP